MHNRLPHRRAVVRDLIHRLVRRRAIAVRRVAVEVAEEDVLLEREDEREHDNDLRRVTGFVNERRME